MARRLMHALVYGGYVNGTIGLKHVEVPIPSPRKDEILTKMEAASLNPVDWKAYNLRIMLRPLLSTTSHSPIPGNDVAGEVVVEIGSDVQKFKRGDKVITILNCKTAGGLAEYCVTKETLTVMRPPDVSAAEGAGLPVAGLAAYVALTHYAELKLDDHNNNNEPQKEHFSNRRFWWSLAICCPIGKARKCTHHTATCGARNIELVKSLGGDEILNYKTTEGASLKSPSGRKYDAVIHCATTVPWSVFEPNLAENGIVVDLTPSASTMWTSTLKKITRSKKKLFTFILTPKDDQGLKFLVGLMKGGKLKTVIDSKYALSRGEEAWSRGVSGHATGKIIVEP